MKKKQNIKCEVNSCKHNKNNDECDLEEIKVSSNCDCPKDDVSNEEETVCKSFEKIEED